jgi:hypothetical protein
MTLQFIPVNLVAMLGKLISFIKLPEHNLCESNELAMVLTMLVDLSLAFIRQEFIGQCLMVLGVKAHSVGELRIIVLPEGLISLGCLECTLVVVGNL